MQSNRDIQYHGFFFAILIIGLSLAQLMFAINLYLITLEFRELKDEIFGLEE